MNEDPAPRKLAYVVALPDVVADELNEMAALWVKVLGGDAGSASDVDT